MKFKEWFLSKFSSTYRQNLAELEKCIKENTDLFHMDYYSWDYMLPDILYDLIHLKTLSLHPSINSIKNKVPKQIAQLVNLEKLYLDVFTDLTAISSLRNLKELMINSMYLRNIEPISNLEKLERLEIFTGPYIKNYSSISKLKNLKEFMFRGTLPVGLDIRFIKDMPNLKKFGLLLRNNNKGFYQLSDLKNIEELDISHNELADIYFLKSHTQLKKIDLRGNKIKDICSLYFLENIEEINLDFNLIEKIPHDLTKNLKKLKKLNLQFNPVSEIDENISKYENCLPYIQEIMKNNT